MDGIQTHVTARSVSKLGATVEISGFKLNNNKDKVKTDAKNHVVSIHFCHSSTLIVLCLCCLILIVVVYSRHCRRRRQCCCCCCHWFWLATFSTTTILFVFRALDLNKSKHVPRTSSTKIKQQKYYINMHVLLSRWAERWFSISVNATYTYFVVLPFFFLYPFELTLHSSLSF